MFPPMTPTTERARIQNESRAFQRESAPLLRINLARFLKTLHIAHRAAAEHDAAQVAIRRAEGNTAC